MKIDLFRMLGALIGIIVTAFITVAPPLIIEWLIMSILHMVGIV